MSGLKSLAAKWALLTLACGCAAFVGFFSTYILDGHPVWASVEAASWFAWVSAAIGALVILGPIATLWSGWEIFLLNAPNDANLTAFFFCLPSAVSAGSAALVAHANKMNNQALKVWPLTLALAIVSYTALMVLIRGLSGT